MLRMHGLAQHATANGGLATFFFIFGICVISFYKKHKTLSIALIVLSIINIFASQARAGLLALGFSCVLFYFVGLLINKNVKKQTLRAIIILISIILIVYLLYKLGNPFINQMVYRWNDLIKTSGGVRVYQAHYFIEQFSNVSDYILGLSKPVVNVSSIPHGVEIEPINIFVLYGLAGWILQYGLVLLLLIYFFRNIKKSNNSSETILLLTSSIIGLFSYQIFSIAFYFFREIRVGLFPWILIGMTIGVIERRKQDTHNTIDRVKGI